MKVKLKYAGKDLNGNDFIHAYIGARMAWKCNWCGKFDTFPQLLLFHSSVSETSLMFFHKRCIWKHKKEEAQNKQDLVQALDIQSQLHEYGAHYHEHQTTRS